MQIPGFVIGEDGAGGRTRTPDLLITNQLLYQLSYTSKLDLSLLPRQMVGATGLEPAASWSQTKHSTKLSYASNSTSGLVRVRQLLYYSTPFLSCQEVSRKFFLLSVSEKVLIRPSENRASFTNRQNRPFAGYSF